MLNILSMASGIRRLAVPAGSAITSDDSNETPFDATGLNFHLHPQVLVNVQVMQRLWSVV